MLLVFQIAVGVALGLALADWFRRRALAQKQAAKKQKKMDDAYEFGVDFRNNFNTAIAEYVDPRIAGIMDRVGNQFDELLSEINEESDVETLRAADVAHTGFVEAMDETTDKVITESIGALAEWFATADALDDRAQTGKSEGREYFEQQVRERVGMGILAVKAQCLGALLQRTAAIRERLGIRDTE